MLNYATSALNMFGNAYIVSEIDDIIENGPEGDSQLNIFNSKGMGALKEYLMDGVEYNIL
jgi:hypothetical protein